MNRRDFILKSVILSGGGVIAGSILLEACNKSNSSPATSRQNVNFTIDISASQYSALQSNGGYIYYSADNIIIARDSSGNFVALSSVCTHQGCTIKFNGTNEFPCPCHGSIYSESGSVIQGPATAGVQKFNTSLNGSNLTVTS